MKVYLLVGIFTKDVKSTVVNFGVFSTFEKAQEAAVQLKLSTNVSDIFEYELDEYELDENWELT